MVTQKPVNFLFKNSYIIQFVASISESLVKNKKKKKSHILFTVHSDGLCKQQHDSKEYLAAASSHNLASIPEH
jgi:protoheme ferro-lyase